MKSGLSWLLMALGVVVLTAGCKSLFPQNESKSESKWKSFDEVDAAFALIVPRATDTNGLRELGFHPETSPNVKILTYVDLIQYFMPNPGITKEDLDPNVRACIEAKEHGHGYLISLRQVNSKRHGRLLLDIFGFKRLTHETGWEFSGLVLLTNGTVIYKLSSGQPKISKDEKRIRPLGPLQEVEISPTSAVNMVK